MAAAITLNTIPSSTVRQGVEVSGSFNVTPSFSYADDGGSFTAFPGGSTAPATGAELWAYLQPGFAVSGTHTVTIAETLTGATVSGNAVVSGTAAKRQSVVSLFGLLPGF